MTHVMIDLETLSTRTNARILSIGAVKFNAEKGIYDEFYQAVATPPIKMLRQFNDAGGFHISNDTLNWWAEKSEEARSVFIDPDAFFLDGALMSFAHWLLDDTEKADVIMWGNGADFDNAILATAYALCGMEQPWNFWNNRCYRTAKNICPTVPLERIGTHHNALDDAKSQAVHLLEMKVI